VKLEGIDRMQSLVSGLFASRILFAAADGTAQSGMSPPEPVKAKGGGVVTVVKVGDIVPPRVAPPCKPGSCLFAGQSVTVIVSDSVISSSILEGKKEFEAATGARLNFNRVPFSENFENFFSDLSSRSGKVDSSIAGAWWVGELVGGDHLLSYNKYYNDPRFPKWNIDDVLTAPRSLLSYGGKKYMVANGHDGLT
jgi:multiple sugar transport system substrate-binding protein